MQKINPLAVEDQDMHPTDVRPNIDDTTIHCAAQFKGLSISSGSETPYFLDYPQLMHYIAARS